MHSSELIILRAYEIGQISTKIVMRQRTSHRVMGEFTHSILLTIARGYVGCVETFAA